MIRARAARDTLVMSRIVAAALAALALTAAGCGSSGDDGPSTTAATSGGAGTTSTAAAPKQQVQSGTVKVSYRNFLIDPEKITVKAGTTVTWTNYDSTAHNVITKPGAPQAFMSKDFRKGQSDSITFTKPGVYDYLCTFHPASMQGVVTVVK